MGEARREAESDAARADRSPGFASVAAQLPSHLMLWGLALGVGVAAGYAAVAFRLGINGLQALLYGAGDATIHSHAADLNPLVVFLIPIFGGLAVGWILNRFTRDGTALGVGDVIRAAALRDGRVGRREGLASALAALVTLSCGGSTGREGPVVHLAAVITSWTSERLRLSGMTARDLLGCGVAAAVSASFNAPIAGALFALEVVLRHYAIHAFGPIVVASVAGAVLSRIHFGNVTEFSLPGHTVDFYAEIPAFMLLGLVAGAVAIVLVQGLFVAERTADRVQLWLGLTDIQRPAVAGAALGLIAIGFPHVIGVGYETTSRVLTASFDFWTCVIFAVVKTLAVAITYAGRMGGGIFSPSLMLGALTGAAFGAVAAPFAPEDTGGAGLYALAGMGAVAAAVLGAPISTTLIVFELTGDYRAAIAVMVAVSLSTVVAHRFVGKSFFLSQLARAGVNLAAGPLSYIPKQIRVRTLMRLRGDENGASDSACEALIAQGAYLGRDDTLGLALPMFDRLKRPFIPVAEPDAEGRPEVIGALFHVDALKALNRILVDTHREEHS